MIWIGEEGRLAMPVGGRMVDNAVGWRMDIARGAGAIVCVPMADNWRRCLLALIVLMHSGELGMKDGMERNGGGKEGQMDGWICGRGREGEKEGQMDGYIGGRWMRGGREGGRGG